METFRPDAYWVLSEGIMSRVASRLQSIQLGSMSEKPVDFRRILLDLLGRISALVNETQLKIK